MKLSKSIKIFFNYFLGPILFIWLSWSIYHQIIAQPNLSASWQHIRSSFFGPQVGYLLIVLILMLANWTTEALKWRLSVAHVQKMSVLTALKAIFTGVSFSVSTPNRIGEYVGRVLYMTEGNRLRTIALTMLSSLSQLMVTLLMGVIGLSVLLPRIEQSEWVSVFWIQAILSGAVLVLLILTVFYFRLSWLARWIDRIPAIKNYAYLIEELEDVHATLLLKLLSLSVARFLIFGIQYFLVFQFFEVNLSGWQSFWAMSVSFLILSIIPSIAILELVQRGKVMLKVYGLFSLNSLAIGLATTSIWLINLIIPSLIGSLLILSIRIFKNSDEKD